MFDRAIRLSSPPKQSFFLWGPRQTGKSTLLRTLYPDAYWVDLLQADIWAELMQHPSRLRERLQQLQSPPRTVVIDEIQKVPALLDEVHWMMENMRIPFVLCGSSARKVRRGHANLLGGRALRHELFGLSLHELNGRYDLAHLLNVGSLPPHVTAENAIPLLHSYVHTYLREEIAAEGLVRNLPSFSEALSAIALADGRTISYTTISRECGVSSQTVRDYIQILEDTLLGSFVPAYTRRPKRRMLKSPKFYFFDVGIVNVLASRGKLLPGGSEYGKALENWIHHELRTHSSYTGLHYDIRHWQLSTGTEVDFILGDMDAAIEVKATRSALSHHCKGLSELVKDRPVRRRILVTLDPAPRRIENGIEVLPVEYFVEALWKGDIVT